MNADERNLRADLNAAIDDDGEDGRLSRPARGGRPDDGRDLGCCLARPSWSGSMRSGPRSTARGVVADERRERSLHGAMLLIVERNGVMEAESS